MTLQERINAAEKRIAKMQSTKEMYIQRLDKVIAASQKSGLDIQVSDIQVSMDHNWAKITNDREIFARLGGENNWTGYMKVITAAEGIHNTQYKINAEEKLIASLRTTIAEKEAAALAKEQEEASLKAILTSHLEAYRQQWIPRMEEWHRQHYDYIQKSISENKARISRIYALMRYCGNRRHHESLYWDLYRSKGHLEKKHMGEAASRYKTLQDYMEKYVTPHLHQEWQRCIDTLTEKCKGYDLNESAIQCYNPQVTYKGFEIWIQDGSDHRVYARLIEVAEYSVLVTPHLRYVVTSKKI